MVQWEKVESFQQTVLEELNVHMQKNKVGPNHTIVQN